MCHPTEVIVTGSNLGSCRIKQFEVVSNQTIDKALKLVMRIPRKSAGINGWKLKSERCLDLRAYAFLEHLRRQRGGNTNAIKSRSFLSMRIVLHHGVHVCKRLSWRTPTPIGVRYAFSREPIRMIETEGQPPTVRSRRPGLPNKERERVCRMRGLGHCFRPVVATVSGLNGLP